VKNASESTKTQYHIQENGDPLLHRHRNFKTRKTDFIISSNGRVPRDHGPVDVGLQCLWKLSMSRNIVITKLVLQHIFYDKLLPATHITQRNLSAQLTHSDKDICVTYTGCI